MLLKAYPRLESDLADDKVDSLVCLQLNQISVLPYFFETAGSKDHQHVLRQAFLLEVLARMVAIFWQTGKDGEWQVIWCLRRPQIIHDVFVNLYNVVG